MKKSLLTIPKKSLLTIPLLIITILYVGIFHPDDYLPWILGVGSGMLLVLIGVELEDE